MYQSEEYNKIYDLCLSGKIPRAILDLLNVGAKKPMGYLPLSDIDELSPYYSTQDLIDLFTQNNLNARIFPRINADYLSDSFFVWDTQALDELLSKNTWILTKYNLPTSSEAFVEIVASKEFLSKDYPEVYALIAYAFADFDNSYLKNLNFSINV